MLPQRLRWGRLPSGLLVGAHALVLLAALAVPALAVGAAVAEVLRTGGAAAGAVAGDVQRWLALLGNTAVVCGAALATALVLGTLLGLLLARTDLPGRRLLAGLALLGACLPVCIGAVFILALVPAYALSGSAAVCGLLYGLIYTPLATLLLAAALGSVDRELEDAALLDAPARVVLLRVTLPQARWGCAALALVVALLVATDFTLTDLLVVRTFAEEIYSQFQLDRGRSGPLLTALPVLVVLAAALTAAQRRYRLLGERSVWGAAAPPRRLRLGRARWPAAAVAALVAAAAAGVPVAAVLAQVRVDANLGGTALRLLCTLGGSALLAGIGALLAVTPAVGLAWSVVRGRWLRGPVSAAVIVLLALPAPVVGISLIALLNRPGPAGAIYDSPAIVVLGYFVRYLPIGVVLLVPAVQRVPRALESAARVDGCGWAGVQRHVYWPLLRSVGVVWLVLVILCFSEIGATVLLAPPGWQTAAVQAFTLLHFGVYGDLAVLALLSVAFILLPWAGLLWWWRRTARGRASG